MCKDGIDFLPIISPICHLPLFSSSTHPPTPSESSQDQGGENWGGVTWEGIDLATPGLAIPGFLCSVLILRVLFLFLIFKKAENEP